MNSYLKKSIVVFIAAMAAGNTLPVNAYDTTILDGVDVVGTPPPSDPPGGTDSGAGSPGTDGSSSEGGGGGEPDAGFCDYLRTAKPANCLDPIAYPAGYAFANDRLAGGSGIPKVIYFADFVNGAAPSARTAIHDALSRHTQELADPFTPAATAHNRLVDGVSRACTMQREHDAPIRSGLALKVTHQETKCLESLERLTAETTGHGFGGWFTDWLSTNRIELSDLGIPETIIGLLDPANSLKRKSDIASHEGSCASWWQKARDGQCSV